MSTKVHPVATLNERSVFGLVLTAGQAGDAPAGEKITTQVFERDEIKSLGGDRAYDRDAICTLPASAHQEAVHPTPRQPSPPDYAKEKYQGRNKVARRSNRLKHSRAVAIRYDKLAHLFLGGILAALPTVKLSCSTLNRI